MRHEVWGLVAHTDRSWIELSLGPIKASDPRVIAHTKLIGGGETASVSFPVSKIRSGGPYVFFCSFPGHAALMHGTISVQ